MIYVDKIFISVLYFHVYKNADFSAYCQFTQARLYYFPNGLKQALFWSYLQVQFQKSRLFLMRLQKNVFKNVFTEMVLMRFFTLRALTSSLIYIYIYITFNQLLVCAIRLFTKSANVIIGYIHIPHLNRKTYIKTVKRWVISNRLYIIFVFCIPYIRSKKWKSHTIRLFLNISYYF